MSPVPLPAAALTIAGSDPSGGAGIQADLKTFLCHGVYGCAALTALTVQDTTGVRGVQLVPPAFVADQARAVLDDIRPQAVKIGMIATAPIARAVAGVLAGRGLPLVLDPVMISTSGHRLIDEVAEDALLNTLLPLSTLLTPNRPEAARLLGGADPAAWAEARGLALLLKDGHGEDNVVTDILYLPGGGRIEMRHPRLRTRNTHGTGCTLAAAITARLARGEALEEAVPGAVAWLADQLVVAAPGSLGQGHGPLLHGLARGREA